jgi:hypothetical protein
MVLCLLSCYCAQRIRIAPGAAHPCKQCCSVFLQLRTNICPNWPFQSVRN